MMNHVQSSGGTKVRIFSLFFCLNFLSVKRSRFFSYLIASRKKGLCVSLFCICNSTGGQVNVQSTVRYRQKKKVVGKNVLKEKTNKSMRQFMYRRNRGKKREWTRYCVVTRAIFGAGQENNKVVQKVRRMSNEFCVINVSLCCLSTLFLALACVLCLPYTKVGTTIAN